MRKAQSHRCPQGAALGMADGGSYHHRSAGFKLLSPDRNLYPQFFQDENLWSLYL